MGKNFCEFRGIAAFREIPPPIFLPIRESLIVKVSGYMALMMWPEELDTRACTHTHVYPGTEGGHHHNIL